MHGQPLIERHVQRLVRAGIERIVINLAWLGGADPRLLWETAHATAPSITYSEEAPRALDTGGGIFRALPHLLPGPFAVVNGDIYTDFPFETLAIDAKHDAHLVLVPNPSYLQGDFGLERGEALAGAAELFTFGGIAVYRSAFFAACPRRRVSHHAADGGVPWRRDAVPRSSIPDAWEDVGTPERLAALNRASPAP